MRAFGPYAPFVVGSIHLPVWTEGAGEMDMLLWWLQSPVNHWSRAGRCQSLCEVWLHSSPSPPQKAGGGMCHLNLTSCLAEGLCGAKSPFACWVRREEERLADKPTYPAEQRSLSVSCHLSGGFFPLYNCMLSFSVVNCISLQNKMTRIYFCFLRSCLAWPVQLSEKTGINLSSKFTTSVLLFRACMQLGTCKISLQKEWRSIYLVILFFTRWITFVNRNKTQQSEQYHGHAKCTKPPGILTFLLGQTHRILTKDNLWIRIRTYTLQWAAVNTQFSLIKTPPQIGFPFFPLIRAINGLECGATSFPPMISTHKPKK